MEQDQTPRESSQIPILPYSMLVGQDNLKLALELAYIAPRLGGVLLSGHRGSGKSTAARAFSRMMYGDLPVTLPINATEDRVVGGWKINELVAGQAIPQLGLLEEAQGKLLYIDEVNLLDDHIVNIILDVTSTGILVVQREGRNDPPKPISFTLVGTMNPEEGNLRPQLLDRFGMMVDVRAIEERDLRRRILKTVLAFDAAIRASESGEEASYLLEAQNQDQELRRSLETARQRLSSIIISDEMIDLCVDLAKKFGAEGHRGEYVMALASQAYSARCSDEAVLRKHIKRVASLALQHRRKEFLQSGRAWSGEDYDALSEYLPDD